MARLEQIINEARSLSYAEKEKLRHILDADLEQQKAHSPPQHGVEDEEMRERRLHWLKTHREEYAGQYVALDGDVLVGSGRTIREAHEQAKGNGVNEPFLVRVSSENEILFAGW
jgi:hypothetical protein